MTAKYNSFWNLIHTTSVTLWPVKIVVFVHLERSVCKMSSIFHQQSYPLVSLIMSPGWMRLPSSSQTEMAMLPLLSATLHDRTSWPSFVLVTRPTRRNANNSQKIDIPINYSDDTPWRYFKNVVLPTAPLRKQTRVDGMSIDALESRATYLPISKTMNTIFKFFEPGFTSFNKNKASLVGVAIVL